MRKETFAELERVCARLKDQDRRMTATPVYVVFEKEKIPTDQEYSELFDYVSTDSGEYEEASEDQAKEFAKLESAGEELPDGFERVYYVVKPVFLQAFLTNEAAERFIEARRYAYKDPYIYVDSGWRNQELRAIIEGLPKLLESKKLFDALLSELLSNTTAFKTAIEAEPNFDCEDWAIRAANYFKKEAEDDASADR